MGRAAAEGRWPTADGCRPETVAMTSQEWPLPIKPAFRREFVDFERGIRMGRLEPNERITQIVKARLAAKHAQPFLIDKWGRGRYWQWICWLPRANRDSKPVSGGYNFGCAKFFISLDRDDRTLVSGLQVERAEVRRGRGRADEVCLQDDWDWHRLAAGLRKGTPLAAELERLVAREGFTVHVGGTSDAQRTLRGKRWGGAAAVGRACRAVPHDHWGWFQAYYAIAEEELGAMSGADVIEAVLAIFDEVTPAMNLVMDRPFLREGMVR
jgi:hypothetical protein